MEMNGTRLSVRRREPDSPPPSRDLKRPRVDDNDIVSAKKRAKMVAVGDIVTIDDDDTGTGAITIEDD
ncbi:hypothetical protein SAMD00023353_5400020 [Rosellinia necatrix]|uniref:Uncharacterized protein n=1 Tax=Rosellinia necatrix TaxID=77044 RepID=A0A1S8A9U6_ROSNE|nr:hypothetical protein SAMD00023353_5400020 [Rosellinia necatrix]